MECFCGPARTLACRIVLLDERELLHEIQDNNTGQALLDVVFRHLDLLETAYFGLRYVDHENQTHWLESAKRLRRQLRGADPHTLYFGVKYYAADPCKLLEEITRYQLFLQVKQDVLRGRLPLDFELAAELAAYVLQSELGDYEARRHQPGYVAEFRLVPRQTRDLEARAAELHRTLTGVTPAEAELSYLSKGKWLDMYGVDLHPVLGEDSSAYFLGVAPSALLVVRGRAAVAAYYWPRVARLHHKGRYFMLRVADNNNSSSTYGFETSSRAACRHLWRCCSDQLAFFRLQQVSPAAADIFALTARLRHSGRASATAARPRAPPAFTRAPSRRFSRTPDAELSKAEEPQVELQAPSATQPPRPASMEGGGSVWSGAGAGSSPRSTRSAPARRGLYYAEAPQAARPPPAPRRSASVESHSSNDSRSTRKHRHRSRRASDAESEASRGSGRRRRHRRGRNARDSASDTDSRRRRSGSDHGGEYELVEGAARAGGGAQVASVRRASHRHRKHRKHRSRSGSPPDKSWLPSELKNHLEFELVDTTGMSEAQRREIPYTVVCTAQSPRVNTQTRPRHSTRHKQISEEHVMGGTERSSELELVPALRDKVLSKHSSVRVASGNTTNRISLDRYEQAEWEQKAGRGPTAPRAYAAHSTSSSGELVSARVSHEHTDSGLGADQDYAYSSERSSDSAKLGATRAKERAGEGGATCAVSSHWPSADLAALSLRRPPAAPRARAGGSLRSLASVRSEGRPARRLAAHADSALSIHWLTVVCGVTVQRHASNNNFVETLWAHRSGACRREVDANANITRSGGRQSRPHDTSLNIILKPLIESTQLQGN